MVTDCHEVPDAAAGRRCVPLPPPPPPRRSIKPTTPAAAVCKLRARQRFVPSNGNIEKKLCEFLNVCKDQTIFWQYLKFLQCF